MTRKGFEDSITRLGNAALRSAMKHAAQARATLSDRAFFCSALSGGSDYNICINSDLTVSCNCNDQDGAGIIGDLREESLDEIFAGERATRLRRALARGRLPIRQCATCSDLRSVKRAQAESHVKNFSLPRRGIMVENTVLCNLDCIACRGDYISRRSRKSMTVQEMRHVAETIRDARIRYVSFFNLGEPFLCPDVTEQLHTLKEINPDLTIGCSTNGAVLDSDKKREAALLIDQMCFSIDGASQESMSRYQRGCDFDRAYSNMKRLVAYRDARGGSKPHIIWKYVVFNWNDSERLINRAIELAQEAKVDCISFWAAGSPFYGISWRFFIKQYFRNLGRPQAAAEVFGGRVVEFESKPDSA